MGHILRCRVKTLGDHTRHFIRCVRNQGQGKGKIQVWKRTSMEKQISRLKESATCKQGLADTFAVLCSMPDKQSCSCFHLKLCFLLFSCISCLSYKGLSVFLCLLVYGSLSASNWTGTTSQSWGPICKWCSTRSKCGHVNKCRSTIKVPDI